MLGRPTHKLGAFGNSLAICLERYLNAQADPRNVASMTVGNVAFHASANDLCALPWRSQWIGEGAIGVHVDRALLTSILELRYGAARAPRSNAPEEPATVLETSTELRLAKRLATDLPLVFARAIPTASLQPAATTAPSTSRFQPELFATFDVTNAAHRVIGRIAFAVEETWRNHLFDHLWAMNRRAKVVKREDAMLASRLKIPLTAQLLEMELPFGDVLGLHAGSVLPIRWRSSARVLTNGSPLFSATVAEHDGKLCLIDLTDLG
ncbi:FliM/FliN family flagellar motor C-terminal domain-containing protein [Pandoraea apista]|uniref:FliM/FliN family flagellar motor C-terminal domain-containing protein n=1 Tax=Pandoraea apista TaxID=93218 RepID=UPI00163A6B61|nr:flagellar motor switch protein FliM [Pandoraea apista]